MGLSYLSAGTAARFDLDATAAIAAYEHALALAGSGALPSLKVNASLGLATTLATIDPGRAATVLDAVLLDPSVIAVLPKDDVAVLEDVRARAAINAGDKAGARHWIVQALEHSGGSRSTHVSQTQIDIRGDAAIIARLRGDDEGVRQYLTYTGAGHLKSTDWIGRYDGDLPVCGQDGDIRPEDNAVIQFAIDDVGHVTGAQPIYASRPGDIGWSFARAMGRWRWDTKQLDAVDRFWRVSVRFEVRCVTRPAADSLSKPFHREFDSWLTDRGVQDGQTALPSDPGPSAADPLQVIPALLTHLATPGQSKQQLLARLYRTLDAAHAPVSGYAVSAFSSTAQTFESRKANGRFRADALAQLLPYFRQHFSDDAATAWLTLERALALEDAGTFAPVPDLLKAVLDTPIANLPENDPIRNVAKLHAAIAKAQIGDPGTAAALTAAADLDARQCSLIDTHPIPQNASISSTQFPMQAFAWRFEGHVEIAYDILPDGSVNNVRTILAYPPFVFGEGAEQAVRRFRYLPPMIGDTPVGCSSKTESINYRIPER